MAVRLGSEWLELLERAAYFVTPKYASRDEFGDSDDSVDRVAVEFDDAAFQAFAAAAAVAADVALAVVVLVADGSVVVVVAADGVERCAGFAGCVPVAVVCVGDVAGL